MKKEDIEFRKKCKKKGYYYANIISHFAIKSAVDARRDRKESNRLAVSPITIFVGNRNF